MSRARPAARAIVLVALAALAACGGDSSSPVVPASIVLVSSNNLSGVVGQALGAPIQIEIRDANGVALQNIPFTISVVGGGSITTPPVVTTIGSTSLGIWTLGHGAGTQSLQVHSGALLLTINATALPGPATGANVVGSITGAGNAGAPAPFQPTIKVFDAFGNGISDVAVNVTVSSGGSVQFPSPSTNASGIATTGSWMLGPSPATDTVTMTATGFAAIRFTVTATAGPATISIVAGKFQTGAPSTALAVNPVFKVLDGIGNPFPGATVQFAVTFGNGSIGVASAVSDAQGQASPGVWTLGAVAGSQTVSATAGSVTQALYATALATGNSAFNLQVRYIGTPPAQGIQDAFTAAAARISQEITAHLPAQFVSFNIGGCWRDNPPPNPPTVNESIVDNVLYVYVAPIDGVGNILGATGPCALRQTSRLPALSVMTLDVADATNALNAGQLTSIITHEMHHALGYGAIWNDTQFGFSIVLISGAGGSNPFYLGAAGNKAYAAAGGVSTNGIPIENTGTVGDGTRDAHWRDATFQTELLTGFLNPPPSANPLSAMSIMELADFGYAVSTASADAYTLPLGAIRAGVQAMPPNVKDIVLRPSFILDETGNAVRIRPTVPPDSTTGARATVRKQQ